MDRIIENSPQVKPGPTLPVDADGIPSALKVHDFFIPWKSVPQVNRSKPKKVPVSIRNGYAVNAYDPRNLVSFDDAMAYYDRHGLEGRGGVMFSFVGGVYAGLDLDECRDPMTGDIKAEAVEMVKALGTYAEVSPSGTGVKAYGIGRLIEGGGNDGDAGGLSIEVYDRKHTFAVTGHRLEFTPSTVGECEAELRRIQSLITKPKPARPVRQFSPTAGDSGLGFPGTDAELLQKAFLSKNGSRIRAYWNGDLCGKRSASEALLGLAQLLTWWTGRDEERLDRIMSQSELVTKTLRPGKWDEPRNGETWGLVEVVRLAIESCERCYGERPAGFKPSHLHEVRKPIISTGGAEKCNTPDTPATNPAAEKCNTPDTFSQGSAAPMSGEGKATSPAVLRETPSSCKSLLGITHFLPLKDAMIPSSPDDLPPAKTVFVRRTKTGKETCGSADLRCFQAFCWRLAGRKPGGTFFLDQTAAAKVHGVTQGYVSRRLGWLVEAGVLVCPDKETQTKRTAAKHAGLALRYIWTGATMATTAKVNGKRKGAGTAVPEPPPIAVPVTVTAVEPPLQPVIAPKPVTELPPQHRDGDSFVATPEPRELLAGFTREQMRPKSDSLAAVPRDPKKPEEIIATVAAVGGWIGMSSDGLITLIGPDDRQVMTRLWLTVLRSGGWPFVQWLETREVGVAA